MNSIPQRSPTKYVLGELQAWARQIVRIESILVFPQVIPSGYLSVDTGKRLWDGQISFSGEARDFIYSAQTGCITHTQSSRTHRVPGAGSLVVMQPEPEADNSLLSGMAVKRGATLPPPLPLPYLNTLESCPRKFPSDVLRLHDTR